MDENGKERPKPPFDFPECFTIETVVYRYADVYKVDPDIVWEKPYINILEAVTCKAGFSKMENWISPKC